jgi:hypothetical protein
MYALALTGAAQVQDQEVLLMRRITPYGYFVLKGIRGITKLKGKLLVSRETTAVTCLCLTARRSHASSVHPIRLSHIPDHIPG